MRKMIDISKVVLRNGAHTSRKSGVCALEAAAWMAGEKHSDHPACVCPVIASFHCRMNDALPDDATRTRLLVPVLPQILNTVATPAVELQRSWMALDWLVREYTPEWLELAGLTTHASELRALCPIMDTASAHASNQALRRAREAAAAAWDAAWAAAGDAAWAAAWDAARAAAGAAAWDAARAAAGEKLAPVVERLQQSAVRLVQRMCAAGGAS